MTTHEKQRLVEAFALLLERSDDVRVSWYRRAIEVEPVDGWKRYQPDATTYGLIVIGPSTALENNLNALLESETAK